MAERLADGYYWVKWARRFSWSMAYHTENSAGSFWMLGHPLGEIRWVPEVIGPRVEMPDEHER